MNASASTIVASDRYIWTCTLCPTYMILTCHANDPTPKIDRYAKASQRLFWIAQEHWSRYHNINRINFSCHII